MRCSCSTAGWSRCCERRTAAHASGESTTSHVHSAPRTRHCNSAHPTARSLWSHVQRWASVGPCFLAPEHMEDVKIGAVMKMRMWDRAPLLQYLPGIYWMGRRGAMLPRWRQLRPAGGWGFHHTGGRWLGGAQRQQLHLPRVLRRRQSRLCTGRHEPRETCCPGCSAKLSIVGTQISVLADTFSVIGSKSSSIGRSGSAIS